MRLLFSWILSCMYFYFQSKKLFSNVYTIYFFLKDGSSDWIFLL